jgi:DNA repair exonuclease SbcCD nuclease subunit
MKIFNEKVVLISDIHLGTHQDSAIWHKSALNYAKWLKEEMYKKDVHDIFILGDILNNRNEVSVTTLHVLDQFFDILRDFSIVIVVGNHDCYYNNRHDIHSIGTLSKWSNIQVIDKPTTVTLYDKVMTFCPWESKINDIPKSDIVFGHFEIQSFKMRYSQVCEYGTKPKDLLDKAPLVISGHFHLLESRKYDEGNILYLGCPYELDWGDYGSKKGYFILDIPTSKYDFVENTFSPKHKKINLTELMTTGITESIKADFKNNIVKLSFDTSIEEETASKLIEKLLILKPLNLQFEYFQEGVTIDSSDISKFEGVDVEGSLIEYIKCLEGVEYKDDVTKYVLDVYSRVKARYTETINEE